MCGKISSINFNNFQSGKRCGCGRIGIKRLSADEIKIEVEARGHQFISEEFIDGVHVVSCICKCGNKRQCELRTLRVSNCAECRNRKATLDYEQIKQYFSSQGCELLEKEYKNARTKLRYKCVCGNESYIVYDSFKRGNRCKNCGVKKISDKVSGDKHPNWNPDRVQAAYNVKFRKLCCSLVKNVLKQFASSKTDKTFKLLGYGPAELQQRIQSHPNWSKVKDSKWHVDHIFPIKAFLDNEIFDLSLVNCLDNLQPLSEQENFAKHDNYSQNDFLMWLSLRGIKI